MFATVVALIIGVVGVCGTLASAVLTQRLGLRAKLQELEHADRLRGAELEAAEKQRKAEQLRECYIQLTANNRNYRDAMLAYAHALKAGIPAEAEAAEVQTARRAQRDTRAEAQMTASDDVLAAEKGMNRQLTVAYRMLRSAEHEPDENARARILDDVIDLLAKLVKLHAKARLAMRIDLGITRQPPL